MEEFSDLPPVTPVGLLLFVSGLNVNFDTFKFSKDSQQETTCVCVCVRCVVRHTHINESQKQGVESFVDSRMRATFHDVF